MYNPSKATVGEASPSSRPRSSITPCISQFRPGGWSISLFGEVPIYLLSTCTCIGFQIFRVQSWVGVQGGV